MTSPLKNTIPTLVFLSIILVLSGCVGKVIDGAINRATNSAKNFVENGLEGLDGLDGLEGLDIDGIDGINELTRDDPCLRGNAVFTNESCNGDTNRRAYNNLREARCIQDNNTFFCTATTARICEAEARLDHVLCQGAVYDLLRTQRDERLEAERLNVVIADWTNGTDEDGVVGGLNAEPNLAHTGNQFLSGLHGLGALSTSDQVQASDALTPDQKAKLFVVSNGSDSGTLTLGFVQSETTNTDGTRPAFAVFKGIDANGDETTAGDARDGVVFVSGLFTQQTGCNGSLCSINRHYAGLLPTTDLGSPLTQSLAQGTWQGWLQARGDVSYNQQFDLTITFNKNTNGGTIAAYVADAITALKIDGVFNNQGFVTGDILHGDIAPDNQIVGSTSPGHLRGLIGDEGAVVAFISDATGPRTNDAPVQYSGGFVAYLGNPIPLSTPCVSARNCVDYADWAAANAGNPTTTPTANRFLTGTPRGLTTGDDDNHGQSRSLKDNYDNYVDTNTKTIEGEAGDGYAIYLAGSAHNAGILSTTRLGSPLSEIIINAQWLGLFQERAGTGAVTSRTITLTINHNANNNFRRIRGTDESGAYLVVADFNDKGVLNGTVQRNTYTGGSRRILAGTSIGFISGLIGAEGLVGVFHSNAGQPISFVGGFVAQPSAPATNCLTSNTCVDYADWVTAANPASTPTATRFLTGTATGLTTAQSSTGEVTTLADSTPPSGLSGGFDILTTGNIHNAGILSTTNLGVPLNRPINAFWDGTFVWRAGQETSVSSDDFRLTVNFGTGDETGAIAGDTGPYIMRGNFNELGVISGTITRSGVGETSTGIVTGLIGRYTGMGGAVGVFHSHASAATPFVGGFVADGSLEPPLRVVEIGCSTDDNCVVDYAFWVASAGANPTDVPTPNRFLEGTATGLQGVTSGIQRPVNLLSNYNNHATNYNVARGDTGDGFVIYQRDSTTDVHNVGLFSTTSLGAPLSDAINNVRWPGLFQDRTGTGSVKDSLIILTVSFNTGTNVGTITGTNRGRGYAIRANFNNLGVISNGVATLTEGSNTSAGVVSGIIGAEGAVGVFHSNAGVRTSYVGGFVAQPPGSAAIACFTDDTCVDYADWVVAANPADAPTLNRFLKGTPTGLSGVTVAVDVAHLNVKDITDHYNLDEGETADGFAIYRPINPHSSGSLHNVGIYSTTNLGAPLSETVTNAQWPGRLQYRVGQGGSLDSRNITLIVGFNANTDVGTITISGGTDYEIDAGFNDMGVISGEVTRRVTTPTADTSTGVISGLIGVDGAVGVFRSNAGQTTSYVGGFVASPPASGS